MNVQVGEEPLLLVYEASWWYTVFMHIADGDRSACHAPEHDTETLFQALLHRVGERFPYAC